MWDNIQQFATFLASIIFIIWSITGAYQWLRYGYDGVVFQWSKKYPRALHTWQAEQIEEKEQAEVAARAKLDDSEAWREFRS